MCGVMTQEEALEHRYNTLYSLVQRGGVSRTTQFTNDDRIAFGVLTSSELMAVLRFAGVSRNPSSSPTATILLGSGKPIIGPLSYYTVARVRSLAHTFPAARDTFRELDDGK